MFDQQEPVDIFSETEKKSAPGVAPAPRSPGLPPPSLPVGATSPPAPPIAATMERSGPPRIIFVLIGLGILAAIGAGLYFFVLRKSAAVAPVVTNTPVNAAPVNTVTNEAPAAAVNAPANEPVNVPVETPPVVEPTPPPSDTDGDGLSDEQELALGTNPQAADSDADGLTDREEVQIYKTDPLKPDTDGDGFLDGQEVKGGYNPNGPGKLFAVPPQQ